MAENKNDFVSDRRLYLNKDKQVVGDDDPDKNELLVAEGGRLSAEDAAKYGLGGGGDSETDGETDDDADDDDADDDDADNDSEPKAASKSTAKSKRKSPARKK